MNRLILEILHLSQLEVDEYILRKERFSLTQLIQLGLNNKKKLFEDKQIEVLIQLDEETEVKADYKAMEKVFNNFIVNVIQHTPREGRIEITLKQGRLTIKNAAEAIPKENLSRIWESFCKIEGINNRSSKGTGLGLAVVRSILEKYHMLYGVENTKDGLIFGLR